MSILKDPLFLAEQDEFCGIFYRVLLKHVLAVGGNCIGTDE